MKQHYIPLNNRCVMALDLYIKKTDEGDGLLPTVNLNWQDGAKQLIEYMEQELCICFLENIIVQAKKAINRHAKELMDNEAFEGQLPNWATKYREAGI